MIDRHRATVLNALLAGVGWYASVYGGSRGWNSTGPLVVVLVWWLHRQVLFPSAVDRNADDGLAAVALLGGLAVDASLKACGAVEFPQAKSQLYVPPWMTGLWVNMALTLRHSFAFLLPNLGVAAAFGAVVGPAAYWFGTLFGALEIAAPVWRSLAAMSIGWFVALPSLCLIARQFGKPRGPVDARIVEEFS